MNQLTIIKNRINQIDDEYEIKKLKELYNMVEYKQICEYKQKKYKEICDVEIPLYYKRKIHLKNKNVRKYINTNGAIFIHDQIRLYHEIFIRKKKVSKYSIKQALILFNVENIDDIKYIDFDIVFKKIISVYFPCCLIDIIYNYIDRDILI